VSGNQNADAVRTAQQHKAFLRMRRLSHADLNSSIKIDFIFEFTLLHSGHVTPDTDVAQILSMNVALRDNQSAPIHIKKEIEETRLTHIFYKNLFYK
jgi:hypothetical protein